MLVDIRFVLIELTFKREPNDSQDGSYSSQLLERCEIWMAVSIGEITERRSIEEENHFDAECDVVVNKHLDADVESFISGKESAVGGELGH